MSTAQKTLIDAIRRIALDSEALASALGDLQKRGVIDGIKTTLGGYNELQDDCCTDGDGNPDDPSGEKDPIDEDAPPEVPEIGDEDGDGESEWSDCETGDPITFAPGGFPQPETCKEEPVCQTICGPSDVESGLSYEFPDYMDRFPADVCEDEDPGYMWQGTFGGETYYGKTAGEALSKMPSTNVSSSGSIFFVARIEVRDNGAGYQRIAGYYNPNTGFYSSDGGGGFGRVDRYSCGSFPWSARPECGLNYTPEYPEICTQIEEWEPDGAINYTLADGCITASSCDPEASAQAQQCNECITICNEDGEERRVCAIGNGQWILYDPNGKYKGGRYDATGRRLEILPAGETGGYLPSERNPTGGGYDGGTIGGGDGWVWS